MLVVAATTCPVEGTASSEEGATQPVPPPPMALLPQRVVAVARDLGDLELMRAVRVALQRATFASIGLA